MVNCASKSWRIKGRASKIIYNVLPVYFNCQVCELPSNTAKAWRIDSIGPSFVVFGTFVVVFIICIGIMIVRENLESCLSYMIPAPVLLF